MYITVVVSTVKLRLVDLVILGSNNQKMDVSLLIMRVCIKAATIEIGMRRRPRAPIKWVYQGGVVYPFDYPACLWMYTRSMVSR